MNSIRLAMLVLLGVLGGCETRQEMLDHFPAHKPMLLTAEDGCQYIVERNDNVYRFSLLRCPSLP